MDNDPSLHQDARALASQTEVSVDALLDCVIVGGGPAGLSAALYLRRFHRDIAVIDQGRSRAMRIDRSHNVPGFPGGISGRELIGRLRDQLSELDGRVVQDQVSRLSRDDEGIFSVQGQAGAWRAPCVLLATGARDRDPELAGIDTIRQSGRLRECPICDGHEHAAQRIGVIGPSEHGAREALFLRHFSDQICLLSVSAGDALDDALHRALTEQGVRWVPGGISGVTAGAADVRVVTNEGTELCFDVLYSALGCHPHAELGRCVQAPCDDKGNLIVDAHCQTQVEGLYAAGDVTGGLDQIVVAMAQGAIAATDIHNRLSGPRLRARELQRR